MASVEDAPKNASVTASDIIARMERLPYALWHVKLRAIIGIATFFDALDTAAISFVLPVVVPLWHIAPGRTGFMIAAGYIGNAVGAFACGWLAEKYGRLRMLILSVSVYSVMSFACALAWNYNSLILFRAVQGFGLGGEMPIAAVFVNEWAKAKGRGRFYLLYNLIYVGGAWVSALVGMWVVPHFGWRWIFVIGAVPAMLAAFLSRMMPESARWLAAKGRIEEADKVLRKVEDSISKGGKIPLPPPIPAATPAVGEKTRIAELFQAAYLRRTIVLWVIAFCGAFLQLGLTAWMPTIYRTAFKTPLHVALAYGMWQSGVVVVSNALSAFFVDATGRRAWYAGSWIIGCVPFLLIWFIAPGSAQTLMLWVLLSTLCTASTMGVTTLYMGEVYPTRIRALGSSICRMVQATATISSPLIIGFIFQGYGVYPIFLMMAAVSLAVGLVSLFWAVETKGRVLEEVSR